MLIIIAVTLAVAILCMTLKWALWIMFTAIAFSLLLQPLFFLSLLILLVAISYFIYRKSSHPKFNHHSRSNSHVISKLPTRRD